MQGLQTGFGRLRVLPIWAGDKFPGETTGVMDQRAEIGRDEERDSGPPGLSLSPLRLSVLARTAIAVVSALLLWTAMYWAVA